MTIQNDPLTESTREAACRARSNGHLVEEVVRRKKAEKTLERNAAELRRSNAEIERFADVAADDLEANCYITKPVDFDQFMKAVRPIEDFWLTVVTLPPD